MGVAKASKDNFFCIFKRSLSLTWKGINQNITQNYSIMLASTSGVHYYFLETGLFLVIGNNMALGGAEM